MLKLRIKQSDNIFNFSQPPDVEKLQNVKKFPKNRYDVNNHLLNYDFEVESKKADTNFNLSLN